MASKEYVITWISSFLLLHRCLLARPCPFYQQGSCFFSDTCNFLHTATVLSEPLPSNHSYATPTNLPRVTIDSPSPIPSPRTSVLLALRLIDDPDNARNVTNAANNQSEDTLTSEVTAWSESLPTLTNEGFIINGTLREEPHHTDDDTDDYVGNWTAISDYNDSLSQFSENTDEGVESLTPPAYDDSTKEENTIHIPVSSLPESDASSVEVTQSDPVDPSPRASVGLLLSPMELSTLHLGPFRLDDHVEVEDANPLDSGHTDTWKPPNPLLPSPPRSPSIGSTFDLLSSPFRTPSSRVLSPYLGAFLSKSPLSSAQTVSSAMLDEVPPLDLGLGSPQENTPPPLDDVDNESHVSLHPSPNDQDLADVCHSQVESIQVGPLEDDYQAENEHKDQKSTWDPEDNPATPDEDYVREQVTAAIRRQSRSSPLHILHLQDTTNFVGDDALDHSSIHSIHSNSSVDSSNDEGVSASEPSSEPTEEESDDTQVSLDNDTTAILAYLRSPPRPTENDTLTSLYDIYSDIAPSKDVISDSIRNAGLSPPRPPAPTLSNSSTPASSLRERVFTPPPFGKKRSGTITADSPPSLSSPITSLNSSSAGRCSPFSVRSQPTGTGSQGSQDETSKKVPFGFRQSFTLVSVVPNLLQMGYHMPP